jgi:hypothetical protein
MEALSGLRFRLPGAAGPAMFPIGLAYEPNAPARPQLGVGGAGSPFPGRMLPPVCLTWSPT